MSRYISAESKPQRPRLSTQIRAKLTRTLARFMAGTRPGNHMPQQLDSARILVIRPDHLGDMLFTGPAMRWLRHSLPRAHIALAIGPWGKPALPGLAETYDELIEIPFPAFERGNPSSALTRWSLLWHWGRKLRTDQYDAALVLRPDHWWGAMLARLADIPLRLGFATEQTSPWLTLALPLGREHAVVSNLRLTAALLQESISPDPPQHPLDFHLSPRDLGEADKLLFDIFGVDNFHPLVIIHPGAGAAVKLWQPEKWRQIAQWLADMGVRVLVSGGPDETALTRSVAAAPSGNVVDIGGQTSFATLAALMQRADVVLGPDSGPLHLAVAVGTPTVHLYGPADPLLFGPWGDASRHVVVMSEWDCAPCGKLDWNDPAAHACVKDIPVNKVKTVTERLLSISR